MGRNGNDGRNPCRPRDRAHLGDGSILASTIFQRTVALTMSTVVILLLYRFGALVKAVVLLGISLASGWLYAKAARLSVIYGSLTVAPVFLYSVYLYACAVLFGAEIAAAWSRPPATDPQPVSRQIKHAIKSLFAHDDEPRRSDRPKSRLSRASGS